MSQDEIYIVLTGTGTLFSNTIKWFTKAPLNHSSISFDRDLSEVYSFGRKKVNNPFIGGLVKENFKDPFYHQAECAVYRCLVGAYNYTKMYDHVSEMMNNRERYKYHLLGLVGVLINKQIRREDAFFCSHFVASVLEKTNAFPLNKPSYFVTPADFEYFLSSQEIYRGKVSGYLSFTPEGLSA
jgi:hypothetical protein